MKYIKMLLVLIVGMVVGLMSYQNFKPTESKALPSKKVVAPMQTAFDSCMEKPEIKAEMYEGSLELMVAHANFMSSAEYVAWHKPTKADIKIVKNREEIFRQVEHKVHSRNDELTKICLNERQLPEIAAN